MNLSHGNTLTPAVCHPLWHSVSTRLPHTNTCRSDCCPLSDPRRQRSSPAQPSSHSRGDLRSWRPSLSWRLTHFWHCLDRCGHRTLAVRRSLSDGLTLRAHLTVVAHSATCLFSLSSVPSLAPIVLLRSTSSNRVLSPLSAALLLLWALPPTGGQWIPPLTPNVTDRGRTHEVKMGSTDE